MDISVTTLTNISKQSLRIMCTAINADHSVTDIAPDITGELLLTPGFTQTIETARLDHGQIQRLLVKQHIYYTLGTLPSVSYGLGVQGAQGVTGLQGLSGDAGSPGPAGHGWTGPQGATGINAAGSSIVIYSWALGSNTPVITGNDLTPWWTITKICTCSTIYLSAKTPATNSPPGIREGNLGSGGETALIIDILRCPNGSSPGTNGNWVSIFAGGVNNTLTSPDHRPIMSSGAYTSVASNFDVGSV